MEEIILKKANKCLNCINKPCIKGCPLNNDIPEFIKEVKGQHYQKAFEILNKTTVLPIICGKICPFEKQCQGKCIKRFKTNAVKIGDIEYFIGNMAIENNWPIKIKKNINKKVLIIGSGPSGLSCAAFLKRNGIDVTIIEKHNYLGGLLIHGIPEFRLPKSYVKKNIDYIINLGIKVIYNQELGHDFQLSDVIKEYDAIFIGIGGNISNKLKIPGEKLQGVYGANEALENNKLIDFSNKSIAVIGGGDVSIDIARTAKKLGAKKINIIYRKGKNDLKISNKDLKRLAKDNIKIIYNRNIVKIIGSKKVEKIELIKTMVLKKDKETIIKNIKNSNYFRKYDYVIRAIGSHPDLNILKSLNLDLDPKGKILISDKYQTSIKKVFAGGDVTNTIGTVAWASKTGRDAAIEIIEYLKES